MNVLSLFSGIGGLELGLERAGMTVVGQVEIDDYCRRVLAKHWPNVPRHDDVRTAAEWWLSTERPTVDVICGGFPCQPFSLAGKLLGVADERWMWPAMEAVIRRVGPGYVVVENVASLVRDRDAFGAVLGDLHRLGFDAEWATLRASDFGAPHGRERVYLLAYAARVDGRAHDRLEPSRIGRAPIAARGLSGLALPARRRAAKAWLEREPRVDRLVDGSARVSHRLRVAGNAVVPQVSEYVGRLIVEHAQAVAA